MSRERKESLSLHYSDFDIMGNVFRAWYDADDNLACVVDETIDEYKPNVMLVINPQDDRKWDDILVNDFGIDLEDVRPKKDNRYQKLDIEYDGLDIYDALIRAYTDGANVDALVADLIDFRDAAVRRAATARLNSAQEIIAQSNETIARAEKSLTALRNRRRVLRNRLARQKENIGREPTKESAAKILRTESQLESNAEKLSRSEQRIENAKRRIDAANADADAAHELLMRRRVTDDTANKIATTKTVRTQTQKKVATRKATMPEDVAGDDNETNNMGVLPVPNYDFQPREEKMPDSEEVKPLFDKDPEILDDEIAFKPVEFDEIKSSDKFDETKLHRPVSESEKHNDDAQATTPETHQVHRDDDYATDSYQSDEPENVGRPLELSSGDSEYEPEHYDAPSRDTEPVLDTITSVEKSVPSDVDTTGAVDNTQYSNSGMVSGPTARPMSPAAMAPAAPVAPVRPLSPITGNEPVRPVDGRTSKPTFAYYLLLILLIGLSVFTLWLYQKKNGGALPTLDMAPENMIETSTAGDTPILPADVVPTPEPVPVVVPEPEPEPDIPVLLPEADKPIDVRYPNEDVLRAAEPEPVVIESEAEVLARKDPYYVSRDDQVVYVPAEPVNVPEPIVRTTNLTAPAVIYDDDLVSVPVPDPEYDDAEYYYEDTAAVYQPGQNQYYQNDYNEYSGGFIDNAVTNEQYDEQYHEQYYDESGPTVRRNVDARDGGQYSVTYEEVKY